MQTQGVSKWADPFSKGLKLKSLCIPGSVEVIDGGSFCDCCDIEELLFERDCHLVRVESYAFYGACIDKIIFPKSLREFGDSIFGGSCIGFVGFEEGSALTSLDCDLGSIGCLEIPSNLTSFDPSAVADVSRIRVNDMNESFDCDDHFLYNKDRTELVYVFDHNIEDVVIPNSVVVLREKCCLGGSQIKSISFEHESELRKIFSGALSGTSIKKLVLPKSVSEIESGAFEKCKNLCEIIFEDDCAISSLTKGMFSGTRLKRLYIPSCVEHIERDSLVGISHIDISPNNCSLTLRSCEFLKGRGVSLLGDVNDGVFTFKGDLFDIPNNEFEGCVSFEHVNFEACSDLRSFGERCFSECGLRSIHIPSHVTKLGCGCFCGCKRLVSVSFDPCCGIQDLPSECFAESGVVSISIPSSIEVIGCKCFWHSSLSSVTFVSECHVKRLESRSFSYSDVTSIFIPVSVEHIGDECFYRCRRLTEAVFEGDSSVEYIGDRCFCDCALESIRIPSHVSSLGSCSLHGIEQVSIDCGNAHFFIEDSLIFSLDAFRLYGSSKDILELTIPRGVRFIEEQSFRMCSIRSVLFESPCSVIEIGACAFQSSGLESFLVPSCVEIIGNECFSKCSSLSRFEFSSDSSLRFIGSQCFKDCLFHEINFTPCSHLCFLPDELFIGSDIIDLIVGKSVEVVCRGCFLQATKLSTVTFEDGSRLKVLGSSAFAKSGLCSITLPSSLEVIGAKAFGLCNRLDRLDLSHCSSLLKISKLAFAAMPLTEIIIPRNVYLISEGAFCLCESLSSLMFEEESQLFELQRNAFESTILKEICLPAQLKRVGDSVFCDCRQLQRIEFADGATIERIEGEEMLPTRQDCTVVVPDTLTSFHPSLFPDGSTVVLSETNTNFVCEEPFILSYDRKKLCRCFKGDSVIKIPRDVEVIGQNCFCDCNEIDTIEFEEGSKLHTICECAFAGCHLSSIVFPKSLVSIETDGLKKCTIGCLSFEEGTVIECLDGVGFDRVRKLELPERLRSIDNVSLSKVRYISVHSNNSNFSIDDHFLYNKDRTELVYVFDHNIEDVVIPNYVVVLREKCCLGGSQIKSISFEHESEVRKICSGALSGTSIKKLVLPKSVSEIESGAFEKCKNLCEIIFEDDCAISSLTKGMFSGTRLKRLYIPSCVEHIERDSLFGISHIDISPNNCSLTLRSCEFLKGRGESLLGDVNDGVFTFKGDLFDIPNNEFEGCVSFEHVNFEACSDLRSFGERCFSKSHIESVTFPNTVESLGESCFSGCDRLLFVYFSGDALSILAPGLFESSALEQITLPASVTRICRSCFEGSKLSSIIFPENCSLTEIEDKAFHSTNLWCVSLPATVVRLGDDCFYENRKLSTILFENDSRLKHIGKRCFADCSIQRIDLPSHVEEIGGDCLRGISVIKIHPSNTHFYSEGRMIYSVEKNSLCGGAPFSVLLLPSVETVQKESFVSSSIRSLIIPKTVKILGRACFRDCVKLKHVVFENDSQLQVICASAFENTAFPSISLPARIRHIQKRAFSGCKSLVKVAFEKPCVLKKFSAELFKNTGIFTIEIPNSVKTIDRVCFCGCTNLRSVTFTEGSNIKRICNSAFENTSITKFNPPKSLAALGPRAFYGCSELSLVEFHKESRLLAIGSDCFANCSHVHSISLPDSTSFIGPHAFDLECSVEAANEESEIVDDLNSWTREESYLRSDLDPHLLWPSCLVTTRFIGQGGQASVKFKLNLITGEKIAVKTMDLYNSMNDDTKWDEMKQRELAIQDFSHPCLVAMKGCYFDDDRRKITIGMEYVRGPGTPSGEKSKESLNLKQVLESNPEWWTDGRRFITMIGVASGITYIHNQMFVHRDLKPSNILIDPEYRPKICDFDIARAVDDSSMTLAMGTGGYMAPEVFTENYDSMVDLYSLGIIFYEIHEGPVVFNDFSRVFRPNFGEKTPEPMRNLITTLVSEDSDTRASVLMEGNLEDVITEIAREVLEGEELEMVENFVSQLNEEIEALLE